MGKPRPKNKKGGSKTAASKPAAAYSIDDILKKAEECMDEYKYDLAQKFCERALELDSDNVKALELTSGLLLEMGQIESAQQCLGRAIFLDPHNNHSKYLTLAQILSGTESRDLYRKGIEIIKNKIATLNPDDQQMPELRRDLSNTYVSISEIYMTDLCDEPEAETESKSCIDLSVSTDPTNPESFQALANFSLVTGNTDEAKTAIDKSLELWFPAHLLFLEKGEGEETTLSYSFRLATAKILMDLEEYDLATKVLESLIEEDEEVVSTWYLLGWLNFLRSRSEVEYEGNARFYLHKASRVNTINPTDDTGILDHIKELLAELGDEKTETAEGEDSSKLEDEPEAVAQLLDSEAAEQQLEDMQE